MSECCFLACQCFSLVYLWFLTFLSVDKSNIGLLYPSLFPYLFLLFLFYSPLAPTFNLGLLLFSFRSSCYARNFSSFLLPSPYSTPPSNGSSLFPHLIPSLFSSSCFLFFSPPSLFFFSFSSSFLAFSCFSLMLAKC